MRFRQQAHYTDFPGIFFVDRAAAFKTEDDALKDLEKFAARTKNRIQNRSYHCVVFEENSNPWGNSYPEGFPVYKVEFIKDGSWFPAGTVVKVMESLNPSFKNHWRINDSQFAPKDSCKIVCKEIVITDDMINKLT